MRNPSALTAGEGGRGRGEEEKTSGLRGCSTGMGRGWIGERAAINLICLNYILFRRLAKSFLGRFSTRDCEARGR